MVWLRVDETGTVRRTMRYRRRDRVHMQGNAQRVFHRAVHGLGEPYSARHRTGPVHVFRVMDGVTLRFVFNTAIFAYFYVDRRTAYDVTIPGPQPTLSTLSR